MNLLGQIQKMLAGMIDDIVYMQDDLGEAYKEIKAEGKVDADFLSNYDRLTYKLDCLASVIADTREEINDELDYEFNI